MRDKRTLYHPWRSKAALVSRLRRRCRLAYSRTYGHVPEAGPFKWTIRDPLTSSEAQADAKGAKK